MKENHGHPTDERDDVARLVRLAGKRRAVPPERAARVKAAARAEWQQEARSRKRRRLLWAGAGLAAAASLMVAVALRVLPTGGTIAPTTDFAILVEALAGETVEPSALRLGETLGVGSRLTTAGESRAAIRLPSGHSVRLDESTTVRVVDEKTLALDRGTVYVDSGLGENTPRDFEIRTPLGIIQEIGTQFEVGLDPGNDLVRVRLREGAVVVSHDGQSHEVQAGNELTLDHDGTVTRSAISTHGPGWGWIVEVTPMLDLEGRSARAFLEWVARERGWKLAFADTEVARSAGEIELGGTVARLTLEEALDAVLPTCRMTYRVEDGFLLISAAPE